MVEGNIGSGKSTFLQYFKRFNTVEVLIPLIIFNIIINVSYMMQTRIQSTCSKYRLLHALQLISLEMFSAVYETDVSSQS